MNFNEILDFLKEVWQFLLIIASGIGGLYAWIKKRKKDRELSHNVLFTEMEKLKIQLIAMITNDVERATEISEKDKIINEMKAACPDCYQKAINKIK